MFLIAGRRSVTADEETLTSGAEQMEDLISDPNTCNECGLPNTRILRFLWWAKAVPHRCRPFSDEALVARQRWAVKCMLHYHRPGSHVYELAKSQTSTVGLGDKSKP